MFEFDAQFDESGARNAERAFFVRSIRKFPIRLLSTVIGPPFFAVVTLAGYHFHVGAFFIGFFAVACFLSVAFPTFMYFARPAAAASMARQYPSRHVRLDSEAISIQINGRETAIPWTQFKDVWDLADHLLLILNPFVSIHLPKRSMPDGAQQFITNSIAHAA
jgi:hypothetical protein